MDLQNLQNLIAAYTGHRSGKLMPAIYVIEPTNHCNLDCIMCPHRYYGTKGHIDFRLFKSIIDQIAACAGAIMLYFVGEPLLHPRLIEMIRYCRSCTNARLILSTNATLLDDSLSKALAASGIDDLILCVDGDTSSTYESIRRGASFEDVKTRINHFLEVKGSQERPACIVQLIEMKLNQDEIPAFRRRWAKSNSHVLVTWLDTWANQLPGLGYLSDSLCPNRNRPRLACADLWFKMVINWQGQVVICCHDWVPKSVLGNLANETVGAIWNSDTVWKMRKVHQSGQFSHLGLCDACFEWSSVAEELEFFVELPQRNYWYALGQGSSA